MSKRSTVLLLVCGAILTALSQVKHPMLTSFTEALAGLGFALAAIAKAHDLMPAKEDPAP